MRNLEGEPRSSIVDRVLDSEPVGSAIDLAVNTAIAVQSLARKFSEKREPNPQDQISKPPKI